MLNLGCKEDIRTSLLWYISEHLDKCWQCFSRDHGLFLLCTVLCLTSILLPVTWRSTNVHLRTRVTGASSVRVAVWSRLPPL